MGRVNKPILILNIIVFAVALSLILFAAITQTCSGILVALPLGVVLLICPICCVCITFYGSSSWAIYSKEDSKKLSDEPENEEL